MRFFGWPFARRRPRQAATVSACAEELPAIDLETVVRAHGNWLALLATVLEREQVISGDELSRSLSELASQTAVDRPAEGRILAFWAAYLRDASVALSDLPSLH